MDYQLTEEDIALLRRIMSYLPNYSPFSTANAVYVSPAQQLRNRANEIEQQERDQIAYQQLLDRLSRYN